MDSVLKSALIGAPDGELGDETGVVTVGGALPILLPSDVISLVELGG